MTKRDRRETLLDDCHGFYNCLGDSGNSLKENFNTLNNGQESSYRDVDGSKFNRVWPMMGMHHCGYSL